MDATFVPKPDESLGSGEDNYNEVGFASYAARGCYNSNKRIRRSLLLLEERRRQELEESKEEVASVREESEEEVLTVCGNQGEELTSETEQSARGERAPTNAERAPINIAALRRGRTQASFNGIVVTGRPCPTCGTSLHVTGEKGGWPAKCNNPMHDGTVYFCLHCGLLHKSNFPVGKDGHGVHCPYRRRGLGNRPHTRSYSRNCRQQQTPGNTVDLVASEEEDNDSQ